MNASEIRASISLERTFPTAAPEEVWEFWTTSEGIEAVWAPDGFVAQVSELDARPGGRMVYAITAVNPDHVAYLKSQGMPTTTQQTVTYTAVDPYTKIAFDDVVDFVPGVAPYPVRTLIEITPVDAGCRLVMTFDAMHDEQWTSMGTMGRDQELDKIGRLLEARNGR